MMGDEIGMHYQGKDGHRVFLQDSMQRQETRKNIRETEMNIASKRKEKEKWAVPWWGLVLTVALGSYILKRYYSG